MKLKFNLTIALFGYMLCSTNGHLFKRQKEVSFHDAELVHRHDLYEANGYNYPEVVASQKYPSIKQVLSGQHTDSHSLFWKLANLLLSKAKPVHTLPPAVTVGTEVVREPYPVYVEKSVPYPVETTVVKEIPIVHKEKHFIPVEVPVREETKVFVEPKIEKNEIFVESKVEITTTAAPPPPKIEHITEKVIEIKLNDEYGLPAISDHVPFNEYALPSRGSDQPQTFHDNESDSFANIADSSPINDSKDGQYSNTYELSDGTRVSEEGHLVKGSAGNDVLVKSGSYNFKDKDGKEVRVDWVADEFGFRVLDP